MNIVLDIGSGKSLPNVETIKDLIDAIAEQDTHKLS